MFTPRTSLWDLASAFALIGLLTTGTWAELDDLGPVAWGLIAAFFALGYILLRAAGWPRVSWPKAARASWWPAGSLLIPLIAVTWLAWSGEFAFSGDHDHHVLANFAALSFWKKQWFGFLAFAAASAYGARGGRRAFWPLVIFAAMLIASFHAQTPREYFARYPATLYTLSVPFTVLSGWLDARHVWDLEKLINVLAPFVWLFVLRPRVLGRSGISAWTVPAVFLLLQKDSLYYIDSVYLETWPMVLLLTAMEALTIEGQPVWTAPLLAALACAFKDAAAIPFLFIGAAAVWSARRRPRDLATVLGTGALGIIPFVAYYLERRRVGVWRTLEITSWAESLTDARVDLFGFRLIEQFWWPGLVALLGVVLVGLVVAGRHVRGRGAAALIVAAGGLIQFPMFFMDRISLAWPGYPRLLLMPWLMVLAPTYLLSRAWSLALGLILGAAFLPALGSYLVDLRRPAYHRNFTEDYATPIFSPIRALIERGTNDLRPGQRIRWIRATEFEHPFVLPLVYRDLAKTYVFESVGSEAGEDLCRCAPGVALLISSHASRNIHARAPHAPYPANVDGVSRACLNAAEQTCLCMIEGDPVEGRLCVWR